ncbi:MAG: nitronate monooxygenase family protein [bacterium]
MTIPELKLEKLTASIPIVQGGMGVRVSMAPLAAAVANEGGIGTISCLGLGGLDASKDLFEKISLEALEAEIHKAFSMITNGHLAVNIMGVISNAYDMVKTSVIAGIKIIVFGAGLPMKLPTVVEDPEVNLVPIVSSARVTELILRGWDRRHGITADALVLEGPLAGGHLGFSFEQLKNLDDFRVEKILGEVLEEIKPFEDKYGRKIPVIAAGGIYTGSDIGRMLNLGASGVQMGTRFVCTEECGVSDEFKKAYLDAKKEDIVIVESPVGMPGRAIRNKFIKALENGEKMKFKCPYRCLTACQIAKARYCIAEVLLNSYFGDVDHGLIFCGANAWRVNKIVSVKDLINELLEELKEYQPEYHHAESK